MPVKEMSSDEIEQFLTCARVGRLGLSLEEGPYIVPVGYGYAEGKIFFHTCSKGLKMRNLKKGTSVCFEVDEALSDVSMFKSVVVLGTAEIIDDKKEMMPYLQRLIDKYRVPLGFDEYMTKIGVDKESELKAVRICLITPKKITGRKLVPKENTTQI
jgi:nitroimidazol reductase NimA-like FMN-containing flavoprotein (pyridoxamine 5'-phosphate oxidase superfamily)